MTENETNDLRVSVCICAFNAADRIGLVLEALGAQTDQTARWDVVIVDNASRDGTAEVVEKAIAEYLPTRARCVSEPQPGLMYARRAATNEARGEFIAFLDDDNIPAADYLERLLEVLLLHPHAGILGGRVWPEWVGEPEPLGKAVAFFALAACDHGEEPFAYKEVTGGPAGAGMVVRRALMKAIFEEASLVGVVTGRVGSVLTGSDDTALVVRAHQLGYEVRYEPLLVLKHRIPASRTTREYLLKLYEGIGRGQAALRLLYDAKARNPLLRRLIAMKEGLRWLKGELSGPTAPTQKEYGPLAREVHELQQRQTLGRFRESLRRP